MTYFKNIELYVILDVKDYMFESLQFCIFFNFWNRFQILDFDNKKKALNQEIIILK